MKPSFETPEVVKPNLFAIAVGAGQSILRADKRVVKFFGKSQFSFFHCDRMLYSRLGNQNLICGKFFAT